MHTKALFLALAPAAFALPFSSTSSFAAAPSSTIEPYDWTKGYVSEFTIHPSCSAPERNELTAALEETVLLARHAKEHVLVHGNTSKIYQKYFGSTPQAPVIGWLDKIASSNKAGVIFRCDDPDKNCATQDAWAGHHRGSNATLETVICPLSYTSRLRISSVCSRGFEIATGKLNSYWAADLMHRLLHVPAVGEDEVHHYADTYEDMLELAQGVNATDTARNSNSLSYFAMEAYAFDIAIPGEGCPGKAPEHDHDHSEEAKSSSSVVVATSGAAATTTPVVEVNPTRIIPAPTSTSAAEATKTQAESTDGKDCHTHDNGEVHCS